MSEEIIVFNSKKENTPTEEKIMLDADGRTIDATTAEKEERRLEMAAETFFQNHSATNPYHNQIEEEDDDEAISKEENTLYTGVAFGVAAIDKFSAGVYRHVIGELRDDVAQQIQKIEANIETEPFYSAEFKKEIENALDNYLQLRNKLSKAAISIDLDIDYLPESIVEEIERRVESLGEKVAQFFSLYNEEDMARLKKGQHKHSQAIHEMQAELSYPVVDTYHFESDSQKGND